MFRPVQMLRLKLVVLERDERKVLQVLADSGAVQLVRAAAGPETAPFAPRDGTVERARWMRVLERARELRRSLEIPPSPGVTEGVSSNSLPPDATISFQRAEARLSAMEQSAAELLKRRQGLLQELTRLTQACDRVSSYRSLNVPLRGTDEYSFLHFITGTLPADRVEHLKKLEENTLLLPLPQREGRQPLVAITARRGRVALEQSLREAGFQPDDLPAAEGTGSNLFWEASERERGRVSQALDQLATEFHTLGTLCVQPLSEIEQHAKREHCLLEAAQNFPRTERAVLITAWSPSHDAAGVERHIRQVTAGRCAIHMTSPENLAGEQAPVLLRHSRLLRPFEMLVETYGLPRYQELEPTLFVAISYVLMFGIMFGDAGHGALLAAGGLSALLAGRSQRLRDMGVLLFSVGLSSMVFGVTYGSYFGLASFKRYALWHDPLEGDPMSLMYGAIGIGIAMISLGLILNVVNHFRRGDVLGALLGKFGVMGALFYWGVLALLANSETFASHGGLGLAIVLFLVVPMAGWALKEPLEYVLQQHKARFVGAGPTAEAKTHSAEGGSGLFAAVAESVVGVFEAVLSYLANTISFVRLAAYAMSHAALLVAAFMLAEAVKEVPAAGGALGVMVIVLGNAVAIVLEGIIASVQALRLEYYEFFGKFFSGMGQAFRPFRLVVEEQPAT